MYINNVLWREFCTSAVCIKTLHVKLLDTKYSQKMVYYVQNCTVFMRKARYVSK